MQDKDDQRDGLNPIVNLFILGENQKTLCYSNILMHLVFLLFGFS